MWVENKYSKKLAAVYFLGKLFIVLRMTHLTVFHCFLRTTVMDSETWHNVSAEWRQHNTKQVASVLCGWSQGETQEAFVIELPKLLFKPFSIHGVGEQIHLRNSSMDAGEHWRVSMSNLHSFWCLTIYEMLWFLFLIVHKNIYGISYNIVPKYIFSSTTKSLPRNFFA